MVQSVQRVLALVLTLAAAGCASIQEPLPPLDEEPLPFTQPTAQRPKGGGLFVPHGGTSLVADQRAHRVGDVLTVMLEEETQASKGAKTDVKKNSSVTVQPSLFDARKLLGGLSVDGGRDFKGEGTTSQNNQLSGSMTVIVQQVLPNGLLHIKGDRSLTLNQGDEMLRLSGYVRSTDVDQYNRVSSLRVANARISYSGRGALADANQSGWLTRFFLSPLFPF